MCVFGILKRLCVKTDGIFSIFMEFLNVCTNSWVVKLNVMLLFVASLIPLADSFATNIPFGDVLGNILLRSQD